MAYLFRGDIYKVLFHRGSPDSWHIWGCHFRIPGSFGFTCTRRLEGELGHGVVEVLVKHPNQKIFNLVFEKVYVQVVTTDL